MVVSSYSCVCVCVCAQSCHFVTLWTVQGSKITGLDEESCMEIVKNPSRKIKIDCMNKFRKVVGQMKTTCKQKITWFSQSFLTELTLKQGVDCTVPLITTFFSKYLVGPLHLQVHDLGVCNMFMVLGLIVSEDINSIGYKGLTMEPSAYIFCIWGGSWNQFLNIQRQLYRANGKSWQLIENRTILSGKLKKKYE